MTSLAFSAGTAETVHGRGGLIQYLSFELNGRPYAVPLIQVAEITPICELRKIPHMPRSVEGLMDLRGSVFPVLNLRARLGLRSDGAVPPPDNIIILDQSGARLGVLVDRVLSVLSVTGDQRMPASPLLAGSEGALAEGFILVDNQVVVILDTLALGSSGATHHHHAIAAISNVEQKLDADLQHLLELAPSKADKEAQDHRITPQIETAIRHTEEEVTKVVDRIELMLAATDKAFNGLILLKQQALLGRIKDLEAPIAELERIGQRLQSEVFEALHRLQFQDIARQKLERVLKHIHGLQQVIGHRFRDIGKPS